MTLVAEQPRTVTPEELLTMPDNNSLELVNGRIVEKNVSLESSETELAFGTRLHAFLQSNRVARVFPASLGYRCFRDDPDKIRKPDTTVVRTERLNALPDPNPGYMPIVPDLAVEVVSPKDLSYEVEEKVREYLDAGFPLVWVAHPKSRTITVHQAGQRPVIFTADDEITAEQVMPGFRCKVAHFFPAPVVPSRQAER